MDGRYTIFGQDEGTMGSNKGVSIPRAGVWPIAAKDIAPAKYTTGRPRHAFFSDYHIPEQQPCTLRFLGYPDKVF